MTIVRDYTSILSGYSWAMAASAPALTPRQPAFVTFSFPTSAPEHVAEIYRGAISTWRAFSASDQDLARDALDQWADASGIVFLEAKGGNGDILFQWLDFNRVPGSERFGGFAYYPHGWDPYGGTETQEFTDIGGDVFMNAALRETSYASAGARTDTFLHEIGHALGFKHSFQGNSFNNRTLALDLDDTSRTVMSYTHAVEGPTIELGPLDLAAVAAVYGGPDSDGAHVASWRWNARLETLTLVGKGGNDRIYGTSALDDIDGARGADSLYGLAGNDILYGGDGNDLLIGGAGDDLLTGGLGRDNLKGGDGEDRFDFDSALECRVGAARDTVTFDFGDTIDLLTIDADTDGGRGNQRFTWIGSAAFSGVDGQLRFANGLLQGDQNGDRRADFEIKVVGYLTAGDVIL